MCSDSTDIMWRFTNADGLATFSIKTNSKLPLIPQSWMEEYPCSEYSLHPKQKVAIALP